MYFFASRKLSGGPKWRRCRQEYYLWRTQTATEGNLVNMIADNIEIPCYFTFHLSNDIPAIYMHSERKKSPGKMTKLLSIHEITDTTNSYVLQNSPVIHACGGCDSTSALLRCGKCEMIGLIQKSKEMQSCFFILPNATASPAQAASTDVWRKTSRCIGLPLVHKVYMPQHRPRSSSLKDSLQLNSQLCSTISVSIFKLWFVRLYVIAKLILSAVDGKWQTVFYPHVLSI